MSYAAIKTTLIEIYCEAYVAIEYNVLAFTLLLSGAF